MRHATLLVIATVGTLLAAASAADAARKRFKRAPAPALGILTLPLQLLTHGTPTPRASRGARRSHAGRVRVRSEARAQPGASGAAVATAAVVTSTSATAAAAVPTTAVAPTPAAASAVGSMPAPFNAYEDMLGYALWPNDYAKRFWSRGYGDIMSSVISPAALIAATGPQAGERRGRRVASARSSAAEVTSSVTVAGMCGPQTKEQVSAPVDRIERALELNAAQRLKLEALRAAAMEAVERGQAACRDALPLTPSERLGAMLDALWALRDADILFRTPLEAFYRSLTEEQRERLARGSQGGSPPTGSTCTLAVNDLPIDEIARSFTPTPEQRAGLAMLQGLAADLSKYLATACPQETPPTPVERLDAAGIRVGALLYAAMNLAPALSGFQVELTDEQKQKLNSLGR